ncbi:MAG: hypothetical protein AAF530_00050 [Pseudomonadota bacterium]
MTLRNDLLHKIEYCQRPYFDIRLASSIGDEPRYVAELQTRTREGYKVGLSVTNPVVEGDMVDLLCDLGCQRIDVEAKILALYAANDGVIGHLTSDECSRAVG